MGPATATSISGLPGPAHTLRVLLAEDDGTNRLVTTALLERLGYRTDAVCDGIAAVEAAGTADYDIILMDLVLPGLSGLEAAQGIAAQAREGRHPPIIAMTGNLSVVDQAACAAAGMRVFLAKPVTREKLALALREARGGSERPGTRAEDGAGAEDFGEARLDASEIEALRRSLGDDADTIIDVFLAETEKRLSRMEKLVNAEQRATLHREAHSLKSAAATFGCHALAALAHAIEEEAETLDAAALAVRLAALSQAYQSAKIALAARPT